MKTTKGIAHKEWTCNFKGCKKKITKGEKYFLWHIQPGYMAQRQHTSHGQPANPESVAKKTTKATKKKATKKKAARKVTKKKATKKATKKTVLRKKKLGRKRRVTKTTKKGGK